MVASKLRSRVTQYSWQMTWVSVSTSHDKLSPKVSAGWLPRLLTEENKHSSVFNLAWRSLVNTQHSQTKQKPKLRFCRRTSSEEGKDVEIGAKLRTLFRVNARRIISYLEKYGNASSSDRLSQEIKKETSVFGQDERGLSSSWSTGIVPGDEVSNWSSNCSRVHRSPHLRLVSISHQTRFFLLFERPWKGWRSAGEEYISEWRLCWEIKKNRPKITFSFLYIYRRNVWYQCSKSVA